MKLYVEGGGTSAFLKAACREGFTAFLTGAGVQRKPRVVACGGRQDAFDSFLTAISNGEGALLLVDSEAPVAPQHQAGSPQTWQPWKHLKARVGDGWDMPVGSTDADCHLMVQCMESWLISDRKALALFFGQGFKEGKLPSPANAVESISKTDVYAALAASTLECKTKSQYGKGEHSFKLLSKADPSKVISASPWAKRFIEELKKKMAAAP